MKILVVDDEPAVLRVLARLLMSHDIETTCDPLDALELLSADEGRRFDVILLDVSMPGMTGIRLYELVVKARPELATRFVFISGNGSPDVRDFLAREDIASVAKPFDIDELKAAIVAAGTRGN